MNYKQEMAHELARALVGYGLTVYLSKNEEYGFYTDGTRVVSFGTGIAGLSFYGNYSPSATSATSGTGWAIAKDRGVPSSLEAERWLKTNAPSFCNNPSPSYTSPEKYLATYGSSGFTIFKE